MKYLLALLMSAVVVIAQADKKLNPRPVKPAKPEVEITEKPEKPKKDVFGIWLDADGFVKPGPKILNWIDQDKDKVDDRLQSGPGEPMGKRKPQTVKPKPKPEVKPEPKPAERHFPKHWGKPPARQTKDLVDLPGKFGKGSSTLAKWVEKNLREDGDWHKKPPVPKKPQQPNEGTPEENDSKPKAKKPERPTRPELSDDVKVKLDSYKEEKDKLRKELKDVLKKLDKPSRKEVREAVETFHKDNKDRFDAQKELGSVIKEGFKANRPERPVKPEVSDEVKALHGQINEVTKKLHDARKTLNDKLKDAKKGDHKDLIDTFKESQGSLMNELKGIQKQVREQLDQNRDTEKFNQAVEKRRPPRRPVQKDIEKKDTRRPSGR